MSLDGLCRAICASSGFKERANSGSIGVLVVKETGVF